MSPASFPRVTFRWCRFAPKAFGPPPPFCFLLSTFYFPPPSIKIDVSLTLSNPPNSLSPSRFGGSPFANFDTSSVSRGPCALAARPPIRKIEMKNAEYQNPRTMPWIHVLRFTFPHPPSSINSSSSPSACFEYSAVEEVGRNRSEFHFRFEANRSYSRLFAVIKG